MNALRADYGGVGRQDECPCGVAIPIAKADVWGFGLSAGPLELWYPILVGMRRYRLKTGEVPGKNWVPCC